MTNYTPGPWDLQFSGMASTPDWRVQTAQGVTIAHLQDDTPWYKKREELKANAHLIAAAPELLEAIKLIEGYAEVGKIANHTGAAIKLDQIIAVAKTAIAKVR